MNPTQDKNKSFQAKAVTVEAGITATARKVLNEVERAVKAHLASRDARFQSINMVAAPTNTIDSSMTVKISAATSHAVLAYDLDVKIDNEKAVLTQDQLSAALDKAIKAWDDAPAQLDMTEAAKLEVDLSDIQAERKDDIVVYSSPSFPQWQYHAPVTALKQENHRALIAERILGSLKGHVLSDFRCEASFKQDAFVLPMVRESNVQAKAEIAAGDQTVYTEQSVAQELAERHQEVHGYKKTSSAGSLDIQAEDRNYAFQARAKKVVEAAVESHIRAELKGGSPRVLSLDFSAASENAQGLATGHVDVDVRYYGDRSIEETTLRVPFKAGKVEASEIAKTEAAILAEEERAKELNILTEEQSSAQMEAYRDTSAEQIAAAAAGGMDVKAATAQGSNFNTEDAVKRVPILKAMLPADAKPGDKIDLRGYIYELAPTDYNSPDVEHCAYWMACLTDELPGKAPNIGMFG